MNHFAGWMLLLFGSTLVLLTVSLLLRRGLRPGETYNTPARFFLVVLRLAIGWHCVIEGMEKLHTPGWTGEPYLREAYGPLAGLYHNAAGDRLVERLTVTTEGELPPRLAAEWDAYLDAYVAHYGLDAAQQEKAREKFEKAKKDTATWLVSGKEEVVTPAAYPPELKLALTIPQRLEIHQKLESRVAEAAANLPTSDKDVQKRWVDAKAELNKWRGGLKKSLDGRLADLKAKLSDVLTSEQKTIDPPTAAPLPMASWQLIEWSDFFVTWGLIVLGTMLLVGVFARFASLATALLILSFYLAMPPLPGWPESPRLEGHYLLINKTLIEVLALGALTFIPTGRWLGVDALITALFGRRPAQAETAEPTYTRTTTVAAGPTQPVA